MKKILLLTLIIITSIVSDAQIRWGVKIGGNLSEMSIHENGVQQSGNKTRLGFHVGGLMECKINQWLSVLPELLFMQNGTGFKNATTKGHINISQISLPISLKYSIGTDGVRLFATTGVYWAYGLWGEFKSEIENKKMNIYSNTTIENLQFNHFDMGLTASMGVEVNKIMVSLAYQNGIVNLAKAHNVHATISVFKFTLGYLF